MYANNVHFSATPLNLPDASMYVLGFFLTLNFVKPRLLTDIDCFQVGIPIIYWITSSSRSCL